MGPYSMLTGFSKGSKVSRWRFEGWKAASVASLQSAIKVHTLNYLIFTNNSTLWIANRHKLTKLTEESVTNEQSCQSNNYRAYAAVCNTILSCFLFYPITVHYRMASELWQINPIFNYIPSQVNRQVIILKYKSTAVLK